MKTAQKSRFLAWKRVVVRAPSESASSVREWRRNPPSITHPPALPSMHHSTTPSPFSLYLSLSSSSPCHPHIYSFSLRFTRPVALFPFLAVVIVSGRARGAYLSCGMCTRFFLLSSASSSRRLGGKTHFGWHPRSRSHTAMLSDCTAFSDASIKANWRLRRHRHIYHINSIHFAPTPLTPPTDTPSQPPPMAFYGNEDTWSAPPRQPSWEQQPAPPSRSGTGSSLSQSPHEPHAFAAQFEEIDRATDNLVRSGKWFPGAMQPMGGVAQGMSPVLRRESIPAPRGGYDYSGSPGGGDARMGGSGGQGSRHQSMSEYDGGRPGSAGLQGYYQGQRFPGGRQSEAEQMLQAKRRMAAQRERELRNYHQEQQYNRSEYRPRTHHLSGTATSRALRCAIH